MSEILIGTSGWSYDDWRNVVYPPGVSGRFDRLLYMAHLCDTIEINSSFYRIPNPRMIDSWLARVAGLPRFLFSAKLYKGLTHERDEREAGRLLTEYVQAVEPVHGAGRLAAILMQFPWSFKFSTESLRWIEMLAGRLAPLPLAVEVRHTSWLNDEYRQFLRAKGIAFCNIDQPTIGTNIPPTDEVSAGFAYVRFHGRNAKHWFTENEDASERYNYHYTQGELEDWVARIRRMTRDTRQIFVYMNNHVGGQGLANALQLKAMLSGQRVAAPRQLVLAYPELGDFTTVLPDPEGSVKPRRASRSRPAEDDNLLF